MIGMSCTGFSIDEPQVWLDRIVGRFELWEIFSECRHSISERTDLFADLLPSYDLHYSVHSPISDTNIAAINERIREASFQIMVDTAKAANRLDICTMTVHPGLASMAILATEEMAMGIAKEMMPRLQKVSEEYGVTIAIENMPEAPFFLGRTAEALADIIDGTDLSVCFDIGHANTTGQIDRMIDLFQDRIANIHIHDNCGDRDAHMTLGEGNIDFDHVLSRLSDYDGNFIIEARGFDSALESQGFLESS